MSDWADRMVRVLTEAAGEAAIEPADLADPRRQVMIDLLESLSFIEARSGDPSRGEDPRFLYVVEITSMGRCKLAEMTRAVGPQEGARDTRLFSDRFGRDRRDKTDSRPGGAA